MNVDFVRILLLTPSVINFGVQLQVGNAMNGVPVVCLNVWTLNGKNAKKSMKKAHEKMEKIRTMNSLVREENLDSGKSTISGQRCLAARIRTWNLLKF